MYDKTVIVRREEKSTAGKNHQFDSENRHLLWIQSESLVSVYESRHRWKVRWGALWLFWIKSKLRSAVHAWAEIWFFSGFYLLSRRMCLFNVLYP